MLVSNRAAVPKRKQSRDRIAVFPSEPYLGLVSHAFDQVFKPCFRLRKKAMPSPGNQQQPIELVDKLGRVADFTLEMFFFPAMDLSLDTSFVESIEDCVQGRSQVEFMKTIGMSWHESVSTPIDVS